MRIETLAVHGGYKPEPTTKAVAVPIYQTASDSFDNTKHGADLFDLKTEGNIYTRIMNPTQAVLEQRIAEMEGGIGALALASGQAATTYSIQTIASVGDNIIASSNLYGGTFNLFAHTFPQMGINVKFASPQEPKTFQNLINDKTKAIFCESIGNPSGLITDFGKIADIAHNSGIPLIIDNTVPTPMLCKPIEFGADIIVHSLTKYLGGHGNSIGGVIVDSGKFEWSKYKNKFKSLNQPDPSYHGVVYTEALGEAAYIGRARVVPLRNMGAAISPFNAFLILQGIETLPLRMERICANAESLANYLADHQKVSWVKYAGLKEDNQHKLAIKYLKSKASGILSFGIKGGREGGEKFQDALKLITRLVNIGDCKTLACHPATTTHRQLSPEDCVNAGISEDMVRISVGIEHIEDIISDIDQALEKV